MIKLANQNIKKTLITAIIIITMFPTIIISVFYYINIVDEIQTSTIDTVYENLVLLSGSVQKQIDTVKQISDVILLDKSINYLLEKEEYNFTANYDEIIRIEQQIQTLIFSLGLNKYTSSISIQGENGIKIISGTDNFDKYYDESNLEIALENFVITKRETSLHISDVSDNNQDFRISYIKPLTHNYTSKMIGRMIINLNKNFISELFNENSNDEGGYYFVVDKAGRCIFHKDESLINKDLSNQDYIETLLNHNNGYFNIDIEDQERLVVFKQISNSDWKIVHVLSYDNMFSKQRKILEQIILLVFFSSVIIITIFTLYFQKNLSTPLKTLLRKIQKISTGNFDVANDVHVKNELSVIEIGINKMSQNLKNMIEQVVEQEKMKQNLELKILQNQINPHFIYNTLNSIKWMAEIKNTDGVIKMIYVLGNIIKNISLVSSEKTTIRKEILLLDDYVYIQRIRYKGKVKLAYEIESDTLLDKKIIKFTLQPIVENAIFHGIEAKKGVGHIMISIRSDRQNLIICVEDDGVGMSNERVEQILLIEDDKRDEKISGIGLKNVDDRLKLTYGSQYGLRIESLEGKYTKIYITIPIEDENTKF